MTRDEVSFYAPTAYLLAAVGALNGSAWLTKHPLCARLPR